MIDGITTELYPHVAMKHDTTPSRVERAIRHAIMTSWMEMPEDIIESVFGNSTSLDRGNPTNRHYIAAVAEIIAEYDEHLILPKQEG